MDSASLEVLLVPGDSAMARRVQGTLVAAAVNDMRFTAAARLDDALRHLSEKRFDAVFADLDQMEGEPLETLRAVRRRANGSALIAFTNSDDESIALEAMRCGAQDCVTTDHVTPWGLRRTVRHAIERRDRDRALHETVTELEHRARERTAALEQYNARLIAEMGERRAAEAHVRQLSSLYAILSEVNEAIVQSADQSDLFRRACRAIQAQDSYIAAGFADVDTALGTIAPGAVVEGFEAIARGISLSLDASRPEGRGPTAVAAREGRAAFSGNFLRESAGGPWETLARQHNVRSVAALPIRRGGRIVAVFSIFSSRSDFFGPEERALCERLATNLSYALDHFDQRGERDRAQAQVQEHLLQLESAMLGTVAALSSTVEQRDPYTSGHQRRVGELAAAMGAEMALSAEHCRGLRVIGMVHDVGKIGVPAEILARPGKLSAVEFDLIKAHSLIGYEILKEIQFPWPVAEAVRQHHERLDGSGYPQGLRGEAVILEARILAVADVVESMASHRPYRPMLGIEAALAEIEAHGAALYCPQATAACLRLFRERGYRFAS